MDSESDCEETESLLSQGAREEYQSQAKRESPLYETYNDYTFKRRDGVSFRPLPFDEVITEIPSSYSSLIKGWYQNDRKDHRKSIVALALWSCMVSWDRKFNSSARRVKPQGSSSKYYMEILPKGNGWSGYLSMHFSGDKCMVVRITVEKKND